VFEVSTPKGGTILRHPYHPVAIALAVLALAIGGLAIVLAIHFDLLTSSSNSSTIHGSGVTASQTREVASVPGSGAVIYAGNPTHVTTSVTGSGAVTRG
jgi:hypothetical protein